MNERVILKKDDYLAMKRKMTRLKEENVLLRSEVQKLQMGCTQLKSTLMNGSKIRNPGSELATRHANER